MSKQPNLKPRNPDVPAMRTRSGQGKHQDRRRKVFRDVLRKYLKEWK